MRKERHRMTIKNPSGSYRAPISRSGGIRMEYQQDQTVFFGELIDKLGRYEELGEPEDLEKLIRK